MHHVKPLFHTALPLALYVPTTIARYLVANNRSRRKGQNGQGGDRRLRMLPALELASTTGTRLRGHALEPVRIQDSGG